MSYKQKYLKYKEKYMFLKKQIGGNNSTGDTCILNDVFDLDCFLPLTTNRDKDFIFTRRLSKETIDFIRGAIQNYYDYIYNFMAYPNLSYDRLNDKNLLHEISIPIIDNDISISIGRIGKVDYELFARKLLSVKLLEIIEIIKEQNKKQEELNNKVEEFKNYVKMQKMQGKKLYETVTDQEIQLLDKYKSIFSNYYDLQNKLQAIIDKSIINNLIISWNEYSEKFNSISILRQHLIVIYNKLQNFKIQHGLDNLNMIHYGENMERETTEENKIQRLFQNKKTKLTKDILEKFRENPKLNCQIIEVSLEFYNNKPNEIGKDIVGHANSVVIYRFKKDGQDHYLCLRTEPHRHTNIYCRNSVRKAIRNIFSTMPNSHYLDYIINK